MSGVDLPRVKLVELLWQLKQSFDLYGQDEQQFIHFNTLLNDAEYRAEIIGRALQSRHAPVRDIARRLQAMNQEGALLSRRSDASAASHDFRAERQPESLSAGAAARFKGRGARLFLSLVIVASLLAGWSAWYWRDALQVMVQGRQLVQGVLTGDQVWTADRVWVLNGLVFVDAGSLTIEAGTRVHGLPGSALVITQKAQLFARGSQQSPVVFSSDKTPGTRRAGDWGGVVLLGNAPINRAAASIEGIAQESRFTSFGGDDASSSCGLLEYMRIEFAGYEIAKGNELNGLTLGACGAGTIVRNVQVHRGLDDGIEVFGGTVDLQQVLITGAGDDSLDWDMGWRGRVQFLIVQQYADMGDNAFEGDNDKDNPNAAPRSAPLMYNLTLISPRSKQRYQRAMTLRRGSAGGFYNIVMQGFSGESIDLADASVAALARQGELDFGSLIMHDIGARGVSWFAEEYAARNDDKSFDESDYFRAPERQTGFGVNALLPRMANSETQPEFAPSIRSLGQQSARKPPAGEFWNEAADYLGAIAPGSIKTWLDDWTAYPEN